MFKFSNVSLKRLSTVHPTLAACVVLTLSRSKIDITVVEGSRTLEVQKQKVAGGFSKTMNSKHLVQADGFSHAVDIAPFINGKLDWNNKDNFKYLSELMMQAASELGIKLRWGGNFTSFYDGPHFEIVS